MRIFVGLVAGNALELSLAEDAEHSDANWVVARAALGGQMFFDQLLAMNLMFKNVIHARLRLDPMVNRVAGNTGRTIFLRVFDAVTRLTSNAQPFELRGTQPAARRLGLVTFRALDRDVLSFQPELRIFVVRELHRFANPTVGRGMATRAVPVKLAKVRIFVTVGAFRFQPVKFGGRQ